LKTCISDAKFRLFKLLAKRKKLSELPCIHGTRSRH